MSAADFVEAMRGFGEACRAIPTAIGSMCSAIGTAASTCGRFMKETARAYYALLGKYTFPLEETPPRPSDLNALGRAALFFPIPLIEIAWLSSWTWIPLIGNSIQSLPRAFVDIANLALFDSPDSQLKKTSIPYVRSEEDNRNWVRRKIYGAPGYWIGAGLGAVAAAVIFAGRIIVNSFKTTIGMFKSMVNAVLPAGYEYAEGLGTDQRPGYMKYGFGIVGMGIGLIVGGVAAAAVFLGRVITNTVKTSASMFKSILNRVLPAGYEFKEGLITDADRPPQLKFGLGLLGLGVGLIIGGVSAAAVFLGRVVTNTIKTSASMFKSIVNRVLPAGYEFKEGLLTDTDRPAHLKFGMGILGLGVGFIAGGLAAAAIFLGRVITNSAKTTVSMFKSVVNHVLPADSEFKNGLISENDRPAHFKFGMGLPGVAIGLIAGAVASAAIFLGRCLTNSARTLVNTFKSTVNRTLPARFKFTSGLFSDERPNKLKYGMGFAGLVTGGALGIVVGGLVVVTRITIAAALGAFALATGFLRHSAKSFVNTFKSTVNRVLPQESKFQQGLFSDERLPRYKYGAGVLGCALGFAFGVTAAAAVFLGRMITNSAKTTVSVVKSMVNYVLPEGYGFKDGLLSEKDRPAHLKFGMGVFGLGVGFIVGGLTAATIFLGRVVTNTLKTTASMFKSIVNHFLPEPYFKTGLITDADRPKHLKYGMGVLGLGLGLVVGGVTAAAIFLGRVMTNTIKTTVSMFKSIVNQFLPEPYFKTGLITDADRPKHLKYGMGVLGLGLGLVIGGVTAAAIFLGRVITNTVKTAISLFKSMVNQVLPEGYSFKTGLITDADRPKHLKYGMGVLGLGVGFLVGGLTAATIFLGRLITNGAKTTVSMFKSVLNRFLPEGYGFKTGLISDTDRFPHLKYGMGFMGLGVGLVLGGVAGAAVFLGRIITNSIKSTVSMFKSVVNLVLPDKFKYKDGLLMDKDRPAHLKYGMGLPGLVVGLVAGSFVALDIALGRVVTNTAKTTVSMFKSIVNQFLPEPYFTTGLISEADRPKHLKFGVGILGLGFGFVIGGVAAAAIFLGRVITNSFKSTISMFKSIVNHVLPEGYGFKDGLLTDKDRPAHLKYGMGVLGLGLGLVIGGVSAAAIFLGRVITNSLKTTVSMFKSIVNRFLPEGYGFKTGLVSDADRPAHLKYGMGVLGLGLGLVVGGVAAAAIFLGRVMTNTIKTTISMFKSVVNRFLPEGYGFKTGLVSDADRPAHLKYGMGVLGLGLGLVVGGVVAAAIFLGRVMTNTIKTAISMFKSLVNRVLPEPYFKTGLISDGDRPKHLKYGMGVIGLGLGLVVGGVSAAAIFMSRVLTNTVKTTVSMFKSIVNQFLPEPYFKTGLIADADRPQHLKYGMGVLGLGLGLVVGGVTAAAIFIGRVMTNTIKTTISMFKSLVNSVLPEPYFKTGLIADADRPKHLKYGMGVLGLGLGLVVGGLAAAAIFLGRVMTNTVKTTISMFKSVVNHFLPEGYGFKTGLVSDADRPAHLKYGMGILGLGLGLVVGGVAAAAIFLGRVMTNTIKTTVSMFKSMVNRVLPQPYFTTGLMSDPARPAHMKYGMGVLGLGLGLVVGGVAAAAIFLGRVMTNTIKTTVSMFKSMVNRVLPEPYFTTGLMSDPARPAHMKYGMGVLGLGLGLIVGGIAAAGVFLARVMTNTVKTSISMAKSIMNSVLPEGYGFKTGLLTDADRPAHLKYGMGAPGLAFGLIVGCVATAGVFLARVISNTVKTTASMFKSVVNQVLPAEHAFKTGLVTDADRPAHLKYGMGIVGLGLGLVVGGVAAAAVFLSRVMTNTFKTTTSMFKSVLNKVLPEEYQFKTGLMSDNDRPAHLKYGMGLPGAGLGLLLGGVVAAGVFVARMVTNSIKTTSATFKSLLNCVLPEGYKFKTGLSTDPRTASQKYGFGILGLGIGLIAGGIAGFAVGAVRMLNEARKSWQALSGSFINGAAGKRYFGGLGADERSTGMKTAGLLGYAAAVVTTLPVAVMGYLTLRVAPIVAGALLGLVVSPLMTLKKWVNMCCCPRFPEASSRGSIEQGFKNLYSSLTSMGKFKVGTAVANDASGGKGVGAFVRKALTFNVNITTERLLDALLKSYRRFADVAKQSADRDPNFFNNPQFAEAIENVKQYYTNDCTRSQANKDAICQEIDDVAKFVKDYMVEYVSQPMEARRSIMIPANLYEQKETSSWSATFWGGRRESKAVEKVEEVRHLEIKENDSPRKIENVTVLKSSPKVEVVVRADAVPVKELDSQKEPLRSNNEFSDGVVRFHFG